MKIIDGVMLSGIGPFAKIESEPGVSESVLRNFAFVLIFSMFWLAGPFASLYLLPLPCIQLCYIEKLEIVKNE